MQIGLFDKRGVGICSGEFPLWWWWWWLWWWLSSYCDDDIGEVDFIRDFPFFDGDDMQLTLVINKWLYSRWQSSWWWWCRWCIYCIWWQCINLTSNVKWIHGNKLLCNIPPTQRSLRNGMQIFRLQQNSFDWSSPLMAGHIG